MTIRNAQEELDALHLAIDSLDGDGLGAQHLIIKSTDGRPLAAIISLENLERLLELDRHAADRERSVRRGQPWEPWEDDLMLDDQLDETDIQIRTQRTLKSIHERRRWIRRIAAARNGY